LRAAKNRECKLERRKLHLSVKKADDIHSQERTPNGISAKKNGVASGIYRGIEVEFTKDVISGEEKGKNLFMKSNLAALP